MNIEEEYKHLVISHLESLSTQFEEELSVFVNKIFPPEVKFLQIEYNSPTFSESFSVYIFAANKDGKLVDDLYWFLKGQSVVVPSNIFQDEKYNDIEPWETASEILESWLISRWAKAGTCDYPGYIAHHDSYFMRKIDDGSDINWDKIIEAAKG